jgi:spore germination cell wall hydrolase CwlJ-like protein
MADLHEMPDDQLLTACLWAEARGEPEDGQQAVCNVIFNRVKKRMAPNIVIGQPSLPTKSDARGLFVFHTSPVGDQVIDATLNNQNSKTKVTIDAGKTNVCQIALT